MPLGKTMLLMKFTFPLKAPHDLQNLYLHIGVMRFETYLNQRQSDQSIFLLPVGWTESGRKDEMMCMFGGCFVTFLAHFGGSQSRWGCFKALKKHDGKLSKQTPSFCLGLCGKKLYSQLHIICLNWWDVNRLFCVFSID